MKWKAVIMACFRAYACRGSDYLTGCDTVYILKTTWCRTSNLKLENSIYPAYQTTRCHNPELFIMKTHRRERPYARQDKPSPYRDSFRTSWLLTTTRRRRKSCDETLHNLGKTCTPIPEGQRCRREFPFIILKQLFKKQKKKKVVQDTL